MKIFTLSMLGSMLLLSGCTIPEPTPQNPLERYETIQLSSGKLATTTYRIGKVTPSEELIVSSESVGKVIHLVDKLGASVKKGERIITLDTEEVDIQQQTAYSIQANISSLRANTIDSFDAQIAGLERQIQLAETQEKIARQAADGELVSKTDTLAIIDSQLQNAKSAMNNLDNVFITKKQTILTSAEDALNRAFILTTDILEMTDEFLGISDINKNLNDTFESAIAAKNTAIKFQAEDTWRTLQNQKEVYARDFNNIKPLFRTTRLSTQEKQSLVGFLEKATTYMYDLESFLKDVKEVVNNTISTEYLQDAHILQYQNTISLLQQQIESVILSTDGDNLLGLKGIGKMVENIDASQTLEIKKLQEDINTLEAQRTAALNGQTTKTAIAENQVISATKSKEMLQEQHRALQAQKLTQLASLQGEHIQAGGHAQYLAAISSNGEIHAPFDGIILETYSTPGAIIGPGVPLLKIGNISGKEIHLDIPWGFRDSIKEGDNLTITIDNQETYGTILEIAPLPKQSTQTIHIILGLDDTSPASLGGTAKVYFPSEKKDQHTVLLIPRNFIRYAYGKAYIWKWVKEQGKAEKREIQLGTCTPKACEIMGGASAGDTIIRM